VFSENNRPAAGFTLVELLIALAVGSIILAGVISAYTVLSDQTKRMGQAAYIHESGRSLIALMARDIRMAGFVWIDDKVNKTYGDIATPLEITDSGSRCCDSIRIVFDKHHESSGAIDRYRITYYVSPYSSSKGTRNRLFKKTELLGTSGSLLSAPRILLSGPAADYVDDLQFEQTNEVSNKVVHVALLLRGDKEQSRATTLSKQSYMKGNWNYSFSDKYLRERFATTVAIRNL